MAITKSTDLTNSAITNYKKTALEFAYGEEVWGQFVSWDAPIPDDGGNAASFDYLAYGEMDPALTALTEDSDITPQTLTDYNVTVTPAEYGNAVGRTQKAAFLSRLRTQETFGRIVGKNRTRSVDRLIRNGIVGGTQVIRPLGVARTTLASGSATHLVTYDLLMDARAQLINMGVEPMQGSNYVAIVHPQVTREISKLTEWKSPRYYTPSDAGGDLYKGEVGMLAGIRFVESMFGKVYLSGGATAQAATTIATSPVAAGGTSMVVADATGLAIGDYLTIGTLEANDAEQVLVTNVVSTTITIQGMGQGPSNFGFRFAHAVGAAVTEATNVGCIPLIGKQSVMGVYGARTGKYGEYIVADKLDLLRRFVYFGWYWFGGIGLVQRNIMKVEVAITGGVKGMN